jgi:hypothetical protein
LARTSTFVVAEPFKLGDQTAGLSRGVGAALEVVAAEVGVVDAAGEQVPDDHNQGVGDSEDGLSLVAFTHPAGEPAELGGQVSVAGPRR